MLNNSEHSVKVAEEAIKQLNSHTSKEWKIEGCTFARVTLSHDNIFVDHLITTGVWIAEIHDLGGSEPVKGMYVDSPVGAYESMKSSVKDTLDELQDLYNSL
ncbi:hypothetical protein DEEACLCL_00155 [Salmonella phage CRW-SP2]|nr:hypothetical protein DEEACLCL_00155 [Salmonella phage CRW-SP2]